MTRVRLLASLQGLVGLMALGGGAAMVAGPDGHYLGMDRTYLSGSPFADYLVPGLLLGAFVGGGGLLAAVTAWRQVTDWQPLALLYALGLITFEVVEYYMIGFSGLQVAFALIGFVMLALLAYSPTVKRVPRKT